jgi:hypothetical protein
MNMTEQPSEALRLALNEIDRLRRRCLWMTRFFIAISILFWCASDAMFLLRGNVAMGMVFAVITVMTGIFSVSVNLGGASYANTLKILNAIANLSREPSSQGPPA